MRIVRMDKKLKSQCPIAEEEWYQRFDNIEQLINHKRNLVKCGQNSVEDDCCGDLFVMVSTSLGHFDTFILLADILARLIHSETSCRIIVTIYNSDASEDEDPGCRTRTRTRTRM